MFYSNFFWAKIIKKSLQNNYNVKPENIDDVIKRAFKFYKNRRKIYIYKEEETKDE
mgnify:CR=1 FL=1